MALWVSPVICLAALLGSPGPAVQASISPSERIYGGTPSPTCAWPSVVMLETSSGICTGTLVAPQLVVYAAHCGSDVKFIYFGEDVATYKDGGSLNLDRPALRVEPAQCQVYPGHDPVNGTDWAFCKLSRPVSGVPMVPILMGCELQAIAANKAVTLVGFGEDEQGVVGHKRQVTTVIDAVRSNKALLGKGGADSCFGDSGGPAFVQLVPGDPIPGLPDGSWRQLGVTSYGISTTCGGGTFYSLLAPGVPWLEQASGVDITPCTDAQGNWQPTLGCGSFPAKPDASGGSWAQQCAAAAVTGQSTTCGDPFVAGPAVRITQPAGSMAVKPGTRVTVVAQSMGAARVQALYDGSPLQAVSSPRVDTYAFGPLNATAGNHVLAVTAWDADGNSTTQTLGLEMPSAGGCAATPPVLAPGFLGLLVCLGRRRRARLAWAVVFLSLAACGGSRAGTLLVTADRISTQAVDPPTASNPPAAIADVLPSAVATITGTVAGYEIPQRVSYFYAGNSNQTELLIVVSNENDLCTLVANNADSAMAHDLVLTLLSVAPNVDEPLDGTFSVVDPNTVITRAGNYATAVFAVNDAACNNLLPGAVAKSGEISVHTVIGDSGAYITGSLTNVAFGDDVVSGAYVGHDCLLPESIPSQPICRQAP